MHSENAGKSVSYQSDSATAVIGMVLAFLVVAVTYAWYDRIDVVNRDGGLRVEMSVRPPAVLAEPID
ncbi:MAG: hypothetical protein KGJ06_01320 [Pseudomonadota bacterium]|nr:hypothetical protein [Pseudomonadota bacterium]